MLAQRSGFYFDMPPQFSHILLSSGHNWFVRPLVWFGHVGSQRRVWLDYIPMHRPERIYCQCSLGKKIDPPSYRLQLGSDDTHSFSLSCHFCWLVRETVTGQLTWRRARWPNWILLLSLVSQLTLRLDYITSCCQLDWVTRFFVCHGQRSRCWRRRRLIEAKDDRT